MQEEFNDCLHKLNKKKTILFVSYAWNPGELKHPDPDGWLWRQLKREAKQLAKEFDGFFLYHSCIHQTYQRQERLTKQEQELFQEQLMILKTLIATCYLYVVPAPAQADPFREKIAASNDGAARKNDNGSHNNNHVYYHQYLDRGWRLFEIITAIHTKRMVINQAVMPLLRELTRQREHPLTQEKAIEMMEQAKFVNPSDIAAFRPIIVDLFQRQDEPDPNNKKYPLIPVSTIVNQHDWKDIHPVALDHVEVDRVLMISHRWETANHPDPKSRKLQLIQEFIKENPGQFDHVFFDFRCLDQTEFCSAVTFESG